MAARDKAKVKPLQKSKETKKRDSGKVIIDHKQVEEALKASEQNFRNSLDQSMNGIRISDNTDHTSYVNQAFLDIFGYKNIQEVLSTPPQEYYTPEAHADWVVRHEKLMRGEPMPRQVDVDIVRKDGELRNLEVSMRQVFWDGKEQNQTLYHDITERKKVEYALKLSEQNFRNSMDSSLFGVRIVDVQGNTLYANQTLLDIFGYSNFDEEKSSPPQEHFTKEGFEAFVLRREKRTRGETIPDKVEVDIVRKDGTIRHLQVFNEDVIWNGKQELQIYYQDITELKQAEQTCQLSEQNFRNSMDMSAIGIRISDNNDHTSYANKALLEIFGYENIDEVRKNPPQEHYSPAAHASWVLRHEKLLRGEPMPKQVDIDIIRKDGTVRNLDVSMMDVFWDGKQQFQTLYNDITERKAAEAAAHESEEKYRLIVENSSDIIFTLNATGDFLYISAAVKNILGYNAADLLGHAFRSILYPDDIKIVQEAIQRNIMDGHQTPGGTEYRVRHKNGEWRWHNGTGNTVRDVNGKFLYFIGMGRDITEMKRLTEETKLTNEKLNMMIKKLEEQQRQNTILTEMRDMLQACSRMEETAPIIMGSMKKLFPASQGALFLLSNSRSDLESVVTWGDFPTSSENNIFSPDACWGLRRGRAHVVEDVNIGPICAHLIHTLPAPYVCLPLMAKGDILGLLHLKNAFNTNGSGNQEIADLKQMATTLSEYLSLSIANVKLSESLSRQSIQDPQTGLYNRRFMEESLQREITRAARKQTPIGIIMGDLDHFKKFNDVYGHGAGDKIIAQIGKLFNDKFRGSDIACRYGGEEFLIILPETSPEDTFKRADALREEIKKLEMVFQGQILGVVTMSMGIAVYPQNGVRMDELLRVADTALYKAKQEGRDRVVSG